MEENILKRIKILTILVIPLFVIILLLIMIYHYIPDNNPIPEEIAPTETIQFGDIDTDSDPIIFNSIPQPSPDEILSLKGNTCFNLSQGFLKNNKPGLFAENPKYKIWKNPSNKGFYIKNKELDSTTLVCPDKNCSMLGIFNDFVYGMSSSKEGYIIYSNIFWYNIENNIFTEIKMFSGREMTSLFFDGESFYSTFKYEPYIVKTNIDGKESSDILLSEKNKVLNNCKIFDIKDNFIFVVNNNTPYKYHIKSTEIIRIDSVSEIFPIELENEMLTLRFNNKTFLYDIYYGLNKIGEGLNLSINKINDNIFIAIDNNLFSLKNNSLTLVYTARDKIKQLYQSENSLILYLEGDNNYEIYQ